VIASAIGNCAVSTSVLSVSVGFAGLQRWVDKINLEAEKNCAIILVGNKCIVAA
jgi:hypothetical protein